MTAPRVYLVEDSDEPIVEVGTVQHGSVDPKNKAFFARVKNHTIVAHWDGFTNEIRCAGFAEKFDAEEFCRKLKKKTPAATPKE